LVLVIVN